MRIAALAIGCAAVLWWSIGREAPPLKVGSFNIESFPQSERQVRGAFAALAALELDAVALQEITDPAAAAAAAARHLGRSWRAVFCQTCPEHRLGVLYDTDRLELLGTEEYPQLVLYPGARPAFEARLEGAGRVLRIIVVHLKAGGDGGAVRERQLRALRPILQAAVASGDDVVLAGDFNSTADADRAAIAELAAATRTHWASREIECTCYWQRRESCFGAALDHVLTSRAGAEVSVGGGCADVGCQPGASCPSYRREVSDHCPVRVELR
jgi:endonuclease/exonuclease/phosphatase family metal-dependent hydrolase